MDLYYWLRLIGSSLCIHTKHFVLQEEDIDINILRNWFMVISGAVYCLIGQHFVLPKCRIVVLLSDALTGDNSGLYYSNSIRKRKPRAEEIVDLCHKSYLCPWGGQTIVAVQRHTYLQPTLQSSAQVNTRVCFYYMVCCHVLRWPTAVVIIN